MYFICFVAALLSLHGSVIPLFPPFSTMYIFSFVYIWVMLFPYIDLYFSEQIICFSKEEMIKTPLTHLMEIKPLKPLVFNGLYIMMDKINIWIS